jgi:hypothetical protein
LRIKKAIVLFLSSIVQIIGSLQNSIKQGVGPGHMGGTISPTIQGLQGSTRAAGQRASRSAALVHEQSQVSQPAMKTKGILNISKKSPRNLMFIPF